jgi:copper homeostasis protein
MAPLVEACCDSVATARAAAAAGAGRVELCGPGDGGTTPSLGLLARCRDAIILPLHVMIRPHGRDFCYDEDELEVMCGDIVAAKSLGADGVVFGPLRPDGTIHREQLVELVALARPLRVTFHRAFDRTPDRPRALTTLLDAGVDLVLTSGGARTALAGADSLAALQAQAGDRLTVLAGGGIRGDSIAELLARAPMREVHARATDPAIIRDLIARLQPATSEGVPTPCPT